MNGMDFVGLCVLTTAGAFPRIPDYLGRFDNILLLYKLKPAHLPELSKKDRGGLSHQLKQQSKGCS